MSNAAFVTRLPLILRADPGRVVIRPYAPGADPDHARGRRIFARVMFLDDAAVLEELAQVTKDFSGRHREVEAVFGQRYAEVESEVAAGTPTPRDRACYVETAGNVRANSGAT